MFRRKRQEDVPLGFKGIGMVNDRLPLGFDENQVMVMVWVHRREDGACFVHPDTVLELLRKMMRGPAAGTFCDQYELALRRLIEATVSGERAVMTKPPEVATVPGPTEVEEQP